MFCSNCGYKLNGDDKFCTQCGAKVDSKLLSVVNKNSEQQAEVAVEKQQAEVAVEEQNINESQTIESVEAPITTEESPSVENSSNAVATEEAKAVQENVSDVPKKKKGKIVLLSVLGAISLILSILLVLVAFNFPIAKNLAVKTFTSDETYFKYVHNEQQEVWASKIADALVLVRNNSTKSPVNQKMSITLNSAVLDYLETSIGMNLDWLENAEVVFDVASEGLDSAMDANIILNGQKVASLNYILDQERGKIYFCIPELCQEYAYVNIPVGVFMDSGTVRLSAITENLPDQEELQELVEKYITLIIENVEEVEKENVKIEVGDLKQNCTKYTVALEEDQLEKIFKAVLKELRKDDVIEKYLKDVASDMNMSESELYNSYLDSIDETLDNLDELDPDDLKYSVYIDAKGNIIAWTFGDDDAEFSYKSIDNGKKFAKEFVVDSDGVEIVFSDEGTIADGKINSEMVLEYDGDEYFEIERTDYDSDEHTGTITVSFGSGLTSAEGAILSDIKIKIDLESSKIAIQKGLLGLAEIKISEGTKSSINIPSYGYNLENETDINNYARKLNFENLFANLEKAGMPSSMVSKLRSALYGSSAQPF